MRFSIISILIQIFLSHAVVTPEKSFWRIWICESGLESLKRKEEEEGLKGGENLWKYLRKILIFCKIVNWLSGEGVEGEVLKAFWLNLNRIKSDLNIQLNFNVTAHKMILFYVVNYANSDLSLWLCLHHRTTIEISNFPLVNCTQTNLLNFHLWIVNFSQTIELVTDNESRNLLQVWWGGKSMKNQTKEKKIWILDFSLS